MSFRVDYGPYDRTAQVLRDIVAHPEPRTSRPLPWMGISNPQRADRPEGCLPPMMVSNRPSRPHRLNWLNGLERSIEISCSADSATRFVLGLDEMLLPFAINREAAA